MKISTKGRYALRVMIDLAEHCEDGFVPMKTVASRQEISLKYLEKILPLLVEANLIEGVHGKGGGYKLLKKPSDYNVAEIVIAAEGDIAPVACLECNAEKCSREKNCKTLPMWSELNRRINDYLSTVTLENLVNNRSTI